VVNPWIDYGVNLAQYAVGWIPVAGIFAPQIGIFYYNLIEPIMTSAVYNLAYVIGGSVGLVQGVSNVINDSITAGIGFVNAEINWALSFLPPLPPFPLAAAQTTAFKTAEVAAEPKTEPTTELKTVATDEAAVVEKHESSVVDSVETATEAAAEPVTPKPEAEPAQKPESATTDSSGGVAAQGEVRGGTEGAADAKRPEEKKPEEKKPDASKDDEKGDEVAASTAGKPAESSPSDEAKTVDPGKDADAGKAKV
jgi:hypothetical protein